METVPKRQCLVLIASPRGGQWDYDVLAASSMEAARMGLERHGQPVADDAVITVIIDGHGLMTYDWPEHNAKQPPYPGIALARCGRSVIDSRR